MLFTRSTYCSCPHIVHTVACSVHTFDPLQPQIDKIKYERLICITVICVRIEAVCNYELERISIRLVVSTWLCAAIVFSVLTVHESYKTLVIHSLLNVLSSINQLSSVCALMMYVTYFLLCRGLRVRITRKACCLHTEKGSRM